MQTNSQRELCKAFAGPLQTDALESFVKGHGNMVLCVTSGFVETIGRTAPLAYCILFVKSELHYRNHFRLLFQSLNMVLSAVGKNTEPSLPWSCMVVDFSSAQLSAFHQEFKVV